MVFLCRRRAIFPGSCPPSIFAAVELNFCVRDGNRWDLNAIDTDYADCAKHRLIYEGPVGYCSYSQHWSHVVTRAGIEPALPA